MPRTDGQNENGEYKVYYSELGDNFLLFCEWANKNLTEEELTAMKDFNFFHTELGQKCNQRWKKDEKITSVHCYKDGIFVSSGGLGEEHTYNFTVKHWWGVDS